MVSYDELPRRENNIQLVLSSNIDIGCTIVICYSAGLSVLSTDINNDYLLYGIIYRIYTFHICILVTGKLYCNHEGQ